MNRGKDEESFRFERTERTAGGGAERLNKSQLNSKSGIINYK